MRRTCPIRRTGAVLSCRFCNKSFYVPRNQLPRAKYCSRSCLNRGTIDVREPARLKALRGRKPSNFKACYLTCETCKKSFNVSPSKLIKRHGDKEYKKRYCSRECYVGAIRVLPRPKKYLRVSVNGKRFYAHRWVMEQHIGRPLQTREHVDHINRNRHDNRIENLRVLDIREHGALSSSQRSIPK